MPDVSRGFGDERGHPLATLTLPELEVVFPDVVEDEGRQVTVLEIDSEIFNVILVIHHRVVSDCHYCRETADHSNGCIDGNKSYDHCGDELGWVLGDGCSEAVHCENVDYMVVDE